MYPAPSWGVEIGDILQFDIRAWGESWSGSISYTLVVPLNGTSISAKVIDLPSFSLIPNFKDFASSIIFKNKVNCTYSDGSALYQWANITLTDIISASILPVNMLSVLDTFYPDEHPFLLPGEDCITTQLYDDWFIIRYDWQTSLDAHGSWTGNISLSTGIPSMIFWTYGHGPEIPNCIELTLVSP
jgi:hypothetical protein